MNILIVGGSSGLGLEIARKFSGEHVVVTGLEKPNADVDARTFDLTQPNLGDATAKFVADLPEIDVLVYAAGLYPQGRITDLTPKQIEDSLSVAGRGMLYFARELLDKQGKLAEIITITSIAQYKPLEKEVVYNFVKAGLGHFCNGLSLDERVGKVLVVAPQAMRNDDEPGDATPRRWVAEQTMQARTEPYEFKRINILRRPDRVEEVEKR